MNKELFNIIQNGNYFPRLNTTKWREIVLVLTNILDYDPNVNIKLLTDKDNNGSFSPVWWSEVERDGFEYIEWLKINPIKRTYVGRLVKDKKEDFSKIIKQGLDKYTIPYEMENEIFVIYGYVKLLDIGFKGA